MGGGGGGGNIGPPSNQSFCVQLWCFSQRRLVPRKDIMGVVKLPNEEVRQMMKLLADQKFIPQQGWEFRLETDNDFIAR